MTDILITIPKKVKRETWMKEAKDVEKDPTMTLNFRVPFKPDVKKGDKCFVVHDGEVLGFHYVDGVKQMDGFKCQTTGKWWPKGFYIQRSGKFHPLKKKERMKGFRGIRYRRK